MNGKEIMNMFEQVFMPKYNEKILFLVDTPNNEFEDAVNWNYRRLLAEEWKVLFEKIGKKKNLSVSLINFPSIGMSNSPIPQNIMDMAAKYHIVIALTEFSITSSLLELCKKRNSITRGASLPGFEERMIKSVLNIDYEELKRKSLLIRNILNESVEAKIHFSTDDYLYIDLRNRSAGADTGECTQPGQVINLPFGEAYKVPYEASKDELELLGKSKTRGMLPIFSDGEIIKCNVENNKIVSIQGDSIISRNYKKFFNVESRCNIAELGIGCNPHAEVIGNILQDEKVPGLHIAYGMSSHIGGKVVSDIHKDICYPKGSPIEAIKLSLITANNEKIDLIEDGNLILDFFQ